MLSFHDFFRDFEGFLTKLVGTPGTTVFYSKVSLVGQWKSTGVRSRRHTVA